MAWQIWHYWTLDALQEVWAAIGKTYCHHRPDKGVGNKWRKNIPGFSDYIAHEVCLKRWDLVVIKKGDGLIFNFSLIQDVYI